MVEPEFPSPRPSHAAAKARAAASAHADAVAAYLTAAARVPATAWLTPRAPGKWSPAEVTEHLALVYDVGLNELAGGPPMALRTGPALRLLLRLTLFPLLSAGGRFPRGARAPREIRPRIAPAAAGADAHTIRDAALARFGVAAAMFEREVLRAARERPGTRLTHAYFGRLPLHRTLRFCAVHIRHHLVQLPATRDARDCPEERPL